jgi:cyclin A
METKSITDKATKCKMIVPEEINVRIPSKNADDETVVETTRLSNLEEIFNGLRDSEHKYRPLPNYLETCQRQIASIHREQHVDWMVKATVVFGLNLTTFCLSVNYLDRFLSLFSINTGDLKLVCVGCLFIASKYEEIVPPTVNDFARIASCTSQQVLDIELLILRTLKFSLTVTTTSDFIGVLLEYVQADLYVVNLTQYLVQLAFQKNSVLQYLPSMIAAAALKLAQITVSLYDESYNDTSVFVAEPGQLQLLECMQRIHEFWENAPSDAFQAVRKKFADAEFLCVSMVFEVPNAPLLFRSCLATTAP